jgi:hypothetical protein
MVVDHSVLLAPFSASAMIFYMYLSPVLRMSLPRKLFSSFTSFSGASYSLISPRSSTKILS